jgi:hypothetical protein
MRCSLQDGIVTDCLTVSSSYREWTENVVDFAVAGTQAEGGGAYGVGLSVSADAVAELARLAEGLGGAYEIVRSGQYGDWVVMSARFATDSRLKCYFHGYRPVVLNHCSIS